VNLTVRPRQTVAIVGATGSGKSTLFQLLARFYDPQAGDILLDGRPLSSLSKASLRDHLAYVTQDAFLFAGSVRDNLLLGKTTARDDELWTALKLACADEFVRSMDGGLDGEVGERGVRLSGGERQLIAHRLSTVVQADEIFVMRRGHVLARGRHEDLLKSCPYYAELAALAFEEPARRPAGQESDV
jgi:ATP-binding cassette subfamily B protein/subfamily B ATP-binding cassette protein MsbA